MQDLSTLVPTVKTVTIRKNQADAEVIKIAPLKFRQFSEVAKHVVAFRSAFKKGDEDSEAETREESLDLMKLVAEHGPAVTEVICIVTEKPQAWVGDLDLDDILELAMVIVEVNRDFFSHQLAPRLREMTARLSSGQA